MKKAILILSVFVSTMLLSCGSRFEPFPDYMGRHGHSAVVYNNKMYVFGGHDGGDFLNDLWVYDPPPEDTWTKLDSTTSPPVRGYHAAVVDDLTGYIYVYGGIDSTAVSNFIYYDDMWEYNGSDWNRVTPTLTSTGRFGHSAVTDGTWIYIFGGRSSTASLSDFDGYDFLGAFSSLATAPPARVYHSAAVNTNNGRIYVFGGWENYDKATPSLNDLWEYDISGTSWSPITAPPTSPPARGKHAVVVDEANNTLYVFGGSGDTGITNAVWQYPGSYRDKTTIAFVDGGGGNDSITDSANGFIDAGFEVGDSITVTGSINSNGVFTAITVETGVIEIDAASLAADEPAPPPVTLEVNDWVQKGIPATSPALRYAHTAVMLSGKMYVFGGRTGGVSLNDLWAYDPATNTWEQKASIPSQ